MDWVGVEPTTAVQLSSQLLFITWLLKNKSNTQTINEYESTFWELVIGSEKEEAMHIEDTQKG
jgi:hypothetical protein